jgi:hypothetical protein
MSEQAQPDKLPRWGTDGAALVTEPSEGKKDIGWIAEMPSANPWNWLHLKAYQWLNYLKLRLLATLGLQADTELTIASGSVTPTQGNHSIDTEGDAATDNLSNIVTTNLDDGRLLMLRCENNARVVTIKNEAGGAGQIHSADGKDIVLDDTSTLLVLKRNGADWYEVSLSIGRSGIAQKEAFNKVMSNVVTRTMTAVAAAEANDWQSVAYSPSLRLFVAVSATGTSRVMTSTDGKSWTARSASAAKQWASVVWAESLGLFVAVASANGTTTNAVMTSPDGINWTSRTAASDNSWTKVAWSEELGLLVAVSIGGSDSSALMTSPDGINWTGRTTPDFTYMGVCWSKEKNLFVAVGTEGTGVATSPDGITWTARNEAENNEWRDVAWSDDLGLFVAVSSNGTNRIMTSPDGITWTARTSGANLLWAVCWAKELGAFLIVGGSQTMLMSLDGINWVPRLAVSNANWYDVIWAAEEGMFVAVSYDAATRTMRSL